MNHAITIVSTKTYVLLFDSKLMFVADKSVGTFCIYAFLLLAAQKLQSRYAPKTLFYQCKSNRMVEASNIDLFFNKKRTRQMSQMMCCLVANSNGSREQMFSHSFTPNIFHLYE